MDQRGSVEFRAGLLDQRQRLPDFAQVGQHRDQQMHLPVCGGTQDGAHLGNEHGRVGQTPANRAQAERGVQVRGIAHRIIERLVGADVDGANGHWQPLHVDHRTAVGLVLLILAWQVALAPHEQEFAAEQPHTHRTCLERGLRIVG